MSDRTVERLSIYDLDAVVANAAAAFGSDPTSEQVVGRTRARLRAGELVGLRDGGALVAHCRVTTVDHWFGGRRVPAQHVAGVAVPPQHRGRGYASRLMTGLLHQGLAEGAGLSILYPATVRLYRKLGWEHAGWLQTYQVDARAVPPQRPVLRLADQPSDWDAIRACYDAWAATAPAAMARGHDAWDDHADTRYRYVLDGEDGVVAYALVDHHTDPGDWQHTLKLRDWVARTPDGLRAVVGLAGHAGTIAKAAQFRGEVPCEWSFLLPEQDLRRRGGMWWMARPLDLGAALSARGWPAGLTADVRFAVRDPQLGDTAWRLVVDGGEAKVEQVADAACRLAVQAVGPLYTGFTDPLALQRAGLLEGPAEDLAALAALFAGPPPALRDFF